jgi:ABC-type antimicrobial peptide transport system permease subunit
LLFSALNSRQIILGNSLLNLVFGGKPLYFPFSISLAAVTLFLCLFTGWVSALYPVRKALALEPVDALKGGHYE